MMMHQADAALQATVRDYFAGERAEMLTAVAIFVVVAAMTAWLYVSSRSGFALGLMATVLLFGAVMGGGLVSLMVRDVGLSRDLGAALQTDQRTTGIAAEKERVGVVLSKYRYYRYGAAVLAAIALAGLLLSDRGWVHGVAAGLLLVVVSQVLIDHFSERRAQGYHEKLAAS